MTVWSVGLFGWPGRRKSFGNGPFVFFVATPQREAVWPGRSGRRSLSRDLNAPAGEHDYDLFLTRVREIAAHRRYATETMGTPFEDPLLRLTPLEPRPEGQPRLLVSSGFHGYEISGPWGLLHFFESAPDDLFERACIEFLPAVNPWGFRHNTRWNRWGQDPNDGYCPPLGRGLSVEGRILMSRHAELVRAASAGALMLHGDLDEDAFYLYSYEFSTHPTAFTTRLVEAAGQHFPIDPSPDRYGDAMQDGVIYCRHDGSFEDWLFRMGVPYVATTEVPGRVDFHRRVVANAALVERFVRDALARDLSAAPLVRPRPALEA